MTIQTAVDMFLYEQRVRNNAKATLEYYTSNLGSFMDFVGADESVEILDISIYKDYIIYLQNSGTLKATSINTNMRAVKAFYNWLIDEEAIGDCSRKLKLIKQRREEIIPLTDDEIRTLLNCFDTSELLELRNKCLVMVMLDSGLRRAETTRLRCSDVDLKQRTLLVNGKCDKQRIVPIGENCAQVLQEYSDRMSERRQKKNEPFFTDRFGNVLDVNAIDNVMQKLKERTGIDRLRCHLLRHTFATLYIVDGGNLEMLRVILGHSSIAITQIYLHIASNYKLIRESHNSHIDRLHK